MSNTRVCPTLELYGKDNHYWSMATPLGWSRRSFLVNRTDKKKILLLHKDYERNSSTMQTRLHEHEEFIFENVFTENASQENIYNSMAKPVVDRAIEGFNGTIMAYGQTGTGKTHTICGGADLSMKGIIPRAFKHVFHRMKEMKQANFKVYLSAMEIYNDHAFDLLSDKITKFGLQRANIVQIVPRNLRMVQVSNMHELGRLLKRASCNRVVRITGMNDASSRSHCIFSLHLYQYQANNTTKSKIHMIDLSGSEKIGKKRPSGILFNESRHINLSLHYIELVIRALSDKSQDHIPYRNSMITSFLRDSLGGNSNTVMIFTLSLDPMFFEETILTCRFAQRVSLISNKLVKTYRLHSGDTKKTWRTGEVRKSKHKAINCKLEGSDSSLSVLRDDNDEIEEIANLKAELEESKRLIVQLSGQLQTLKTSVIPSTPVQNGFRSTPLLSETSPESHNLRREELSVEENDFYPLKVSDCPKIQTSLLTESKSNVVRKFKYLCTLCGKRMQSFREASRETAYDRERKRNSTGMNKGLDKAQGGQRPQVEMDHVLEIKFKAQDLENKKGKGDEELMQDFLPLPQYFLENHEDGCKNTSSGVENSLDDLSNGEASHYSLQKIESGSKPLMYFIYELIGLSLPSKNPVSGKPYETKDIEEYCEFLPLNLNVQRFKKEYYDRHCDLVEKEFQGCYKLNKMISSVEKLKLKLNEMKYCSEDNLKEKEELEKQIQVEDNKLNHGKAMLEVIRNERIELLKKVKELRTKLINMFQANFLQLNNSSQETNIGNEQNTIICYGNDKLHHGKSIYSPHLNLLTERRKQMKYVPLLKKINSDEFKCNMNSMPHISHHISTKLNAELSHCSTNIRLISRSDTVINSFKSLGKANSISNDDSRISSSSRIKKKTDPKASEESGLSYASFLSEISSLDPSSGVFSLSEVNSVDPSSDTIPLSRVNSADPS